MQFSIDSVISKWDIIGNEDNLQQPGGGRGQNPTATYARRPLLRRKRKLHFWMGIFVIAAALYKYNPISFS